MALRFRFHDVHEAIVNHFSTHTDTWTWIKTLDAIGTYHPTRNYEKSTSWGLFFSNRRVLETNIKEIIVKGFPPPPQSVKTTKTGFICDLVAIKAFAIWLLAFMRHEEGNLLDIRNDCDTAETVGLLKYVCLAAAIITRSRNGLERLYKSCTRVHDTLFAQLCHFQRPLVFKPRRHAVEMENGDKSISVKICALFAEMGCAGWVALEHAELACIQSTPVVFTQR